jgi:hypothetical protein
MDYYEKLSYAELEKLYAQAKQNISDMEIVLARKREQERLRDWDIMVDAINLYTEKWGFIYANVLAEDCNMIRFDDDGY